MPTCALEDIPALVSGTTPVKSDGRNIGLKDGNNGQRSLLRWHPPWLPLLWKLDRAQLSISLRLAARGVGVIAIGRMSSYRYLCRLNGHQS